MQNTILIDFQPPAIDYSVRVLDPYSLVYTTGYSPPLYIQSIPLVRHAELFIARENPGASSAPIKDDLRDYIDLLAAYCAEGSISRIVDVVRCIHERLQWESAPIVSGWVKYLRGMHPLVDEQIKKLPLFSVSASDVMGNNTYTYARNLAEIDVTQQLTDTNHHTNKVYWYDAQDSVTHIKDNLRTKLPNGVAEIINEAGNAAVKATAHAYIYDAYFAHTATGGETIQARPIIGPQPHGASMSQDISYGSIRILQNSNKYWGFQNSINHFYRSEYFGHLLCHNLSPIRNNAPASRETFTVSSSVGITREFWNNQVDLSRPFTVNTSNNIHTVTPHQVTDHSLVPLPPTELDD